MKQLTRRDFLRVAGLAAGGAMVAGCVPQATSTTAPAAVEGGTVEGGSGTAISGQVWCFWQGFIDYYVESAKAYAAKYNKKFELASGLWGWDVYWDKLAVALQTKVEAPLFAEAIPGYFDRYIVNDECLFLDITDKFKASPLYEGFVKSKLAPYTWKGKIYGLDHDIAPAIMTYREDIWKDAGIDIAGIDLWDDFIQAAVDLKKKNPDIFPLSIRGGADFHVYLLQRTGEGYFNANGEILLDRPEAIELMNWFKTIYTDLKIADLDPGGEAFWAEMNKGKYASVYAFSWSVGQYKGNMAEQKGKWKVKALPAFEKGGRRTSTLGGEILGTVPGMIDPDEAWKFQEFARLENKEAYMNFMMTYGNIPPYKPFMEDPRFKDNVDDYMNQRLYEVYSQIIDDVPTPYPSPFITDVQNMLAADFRAVLEGSRDPAEWLKSIADEVRKKQAEQA